MQNDNAEPGGGAFGLQSLAKRYGNGLFVFLIASACLGLATGFSDSILANYFKEAYNVNAQQRGVIEFPRELPGVISIFCIAALTAFGRIRSAVVAQALTVFGLVVLALTRPSFPVMLAFLFVYSLGVHMYIPLNDSIGLSLARKGDLGGTLGLINGVRMASLLVAGVATFAFFKTGWFNYNLPVGVFLAAAALFVAAGFLLSRLKRYVGGGPDAQAIPERDNKFVFRKEYLRYYAICMLYGGRKQIMLVYSPWVLIDLLGFKTDTMSILAVAGSLIGMFFMPYVGRLVDRYGVRRVMIIETVAFVCIYVAYGFLSKWVNENVVVLTGVVMMLVYLLNIVDRMTTQFGMVRSIYMRAIAIVPEDVTPSLSLGMSIDHVVSIIGSFVCGTVWYVWGPEYVFLIAGVMSAGNLVAALGIKKSVDLQTQG